MSRTTKTALVLGQEGSALLWARKGLALALFLTIMAVGLTALSLTPRTYESSLQILLASNDAGQLAPEAVQAESELLQSRVVWERACQELAVSAATTQLSVTAQARLLQVTYRDTEPAQATRFLQTLFQHYVAYRAELQPPTRLEAALRERAATFQQSLSQATHSLQQFDSQAGSRAGSEQPPLLLQQLTETQTQAEAARTEKQGLEQQILTLRAQLASQPEQVETSSVTKYAQALDKMKEERTALEMQRTQLRQKYQPDHRLLRDLEQRLAQAQELITREEQQPPRERTFALNETRQRITNDLFAAETKLAALAPRIQRLEQLAHEYQSQLAAAQVQGVKKSDLERERRLHEEAYLLYQKKAQEAGLDAVLQQTKGVQIRLAEAARSNPQPLSPNWPRSLAGLFMLGMLTASGGVLAVERWRPRVRNAASLQRRFGLNVLAKLPASSPRN